VCNWGGVLGGIRNKEGIIKWQANKIPDTAYLQVEVRTTDVELNAKKSVDIFKKAVEKQGADFNLEKITHDYSSFWTNPEKLNVIESILQNIVSSSDYQDLSKS